MTARPSSADRALLRELRRTWETRDPVPVDLADRMIAAVATADLSDEYALLTLVESDPLGAVRGESDRLTLQFTHGSITLLIQVTDTGRGHRRIDGWIDGNATAVQLTCDSGDHTTTADGGRFVFDGVTPGFARLRITLDEPAGDDAVMMTPRFEL